MDIMAIFNMISTGVSVAETLIHAGKDAIPAITAVKNLVTGAQGGSVTQADLDATEALLDSLISDFNADI